ncbi:zinc finger protein 54-like [Oppia nitens]|uniref:zinc finger protein 54-like n=1 Tax=Oppia nitens TaxID=1686743 RepID=UPI0023DC0231|nr:zinc finger protein 54-like [Oppia nitens]
MQSMDDSLCDLSRYQLYSMVNALRREVQCLSSDLLRYQLFAEKYRKLLNELNENIGEIGVEFDEDLRQMKQQLMSLSDDNDCEVAINEDTNHDMNLRYLDKECQTTTTTTSDMINEDIVIKSENTGEEDDYEEVVVECDVNYGSTVGDDNNNNTNSDVDYDDCYFKTETDDDKSLFDCYLNNQLMITSSSATFKCVYNDCPVVCRSQDALKQHQIGRHPELWPNISWKVCPQTGCSYRTKLALDMYKHERRHSKPHKCDVCGKGFAYSTALRVHQRSHNSALKVQCQWPGCDRLFSSRNDMTKHMNVHTVDVIYPCNWPDCDKQFVLRKSLEQHIARIHKGRVDYRCRWPGCDYKTTNPVRYHNHRQKHEGSLPLYECQYSDCVYKTNNKSSFTKHVNNKHTNN